VRRYEASWKGRKIDTHPEIQKYIVEKLKAGWSPDVISGRMKTEEDFYVSKNVIYRWLYSDRGNKYCEYLCTQRYDKKKRKKKTERVMIPDRVDISERPEEVETRGVAGHWEGDTVVSGKNTKSTVAITVLSERKSRLARIRKITDLRPITFNEAVVSIQDTVRIETVTLDNGTPIPPPSAILLVSVGPPQTGCFFMSSQYHLLWQLQTVSCNPGSFLVYGSDNLQSSAVLLLYSRQYLNPSLQTV
jgi:IS30 family transposase